MDDAIEIEVYLTASVKVKQRPVTEKRKIKDESQPSTSQSIDAKFDMILKTMERLVEKLSLDDKPANGNQ